MEPEDRKAFIAEYLAAQREAKELLAYKSRFDAFCGFISQAECVRVVESRERTNGKTAKHYLIVKKPTQPILVVKLPLYSSAPESGDTIFWTQPKDFTDEVEILAIKKPDGTVKLLKDNFKNTDKKSCQTMFFVEPSRDLIAVRSKLIALQEYIDTNRDQFDSTVEAQKLAAVAKVSGWPGQKPRTKSI
jgi:hypothetical protein